MLHSSKAARSHAACESDVMQLPRCRKSINFIGSALFVMVGRQRDGRERSNTVQGDRFGLVPDFVDMDF